MRCGQPRIKVRLDKFPKQGPHLSDFNEKLEPQRLVQVTAQLGNGPETNSAGL